MAGQEQRMRAGEEIRDRSRSPRRCSEDALSRRNSRPEQLVQTAGAVGDEGGQVSTSSVVTITVLNAVDGSILLGPEQLDSKTSIRQLGARLRIQRTEPVTVAFFDADRKLDNALFLNEIGHTCTLELTAVFEQQSISISYSKGVHVYTHSTYSLHVVPSATLEAFKAAAEKNGRTLEKMPGVQFLRRMQSRCYHQKDRPQEAELLEHFLLDADEAWVDEFNTGYSRGTVYRRAFVKGHQISDEYDYSFD